MSIKKLLIVILIIASPIVAQAASTYYNASDPYTPPTSTGTVYYIDGTNGSDSNDGLAATTGGGHGPWQTLGKATNEYNNWGAGAQFLILAGKYYTSLSLPYAGQGYWTQGTSAAPLVFAAYGNGEVIIDGSPTSTLGSWSVYSGSVYQATFPTAPTGGIIAVVVDQDFRDYYPVASAAAITGPGMWYYNASNKTIYVWTAAGGSYAAGSSPSGRDVITVKYDVPSSASYGIYLHDGTDYITFSNLTIRGFSSAGIFLYNYSAPLSNITINHCKIEFNALGGISTNGTNNITVTKNYILGNVLDNWPRGTWGGCASWDGGGQGWPPAVGIVGSTNTILSGNIVGWNNGEGIIFLDSASSGSNVANQNIIHDNWGTNFYFDHGNNSTVSNNFIYSSGYHPTDIYQGCNGTETINMEKRARANGISSANEPGDGSTIGTGNTAYNNIILGCRIGIGGPQDEMTGAGIRNETYDSNTIIMPNYNPTGVTSYYGVYFAANSGNNTGSVFKNNIILGQDANGTLAVWSTDSGITWNNNLYYHPNNSTPFSYKGTNYGFSNWKTQTGQDANSVNSAPLLNRTDWSTLVQ